MNLINLPFRKNAAARLACGTWVALCCLVLSAALVGSSGASANTIRTSYHWQRHSDPSHMPMAVAGRILRRWHVQHVRVCDRSGYRRAVEIAESWWNRTPSRLGILQSCHRPQIVIRRYHRHSARVAGYGYYPPDGRVYLNHYWMRKLDRIQRADSAAHELGHALGLTHLPGCALMYGKGGFGGHCPTLHGRFACGPQRRDVRELIRRYGGRLGNFRGFSCTNRRPEGAPIRTTRLVLG